MLKERSGQGSKDTVDVKVLLDFLRAMHGNKEAEASHVKNHISMLDRDIRQVKFKCFLQMFPSSPPSIKIVSL